jgi:hypothetical protein
MVAISGDSTAADNLETACDGGSYNLGGGGVVAASVTGSVGSVGGDVSGKVIGGGSGTITGDGVRAASVTGAVGSVTGSVGSVVETVTADASAIRSAVGMSTNNLDTQLSAIKTDTAVARSAGVVTIGVISNAGTAVEAYAYGGQTVTFAGLDASGNRSGVTVS